ncbi:MAG: alginate export family protein [Chloroflexia bacterium]|nr:alginate export family protein [Chloroflexia bacterium]
MKKLIIVFALFVLTALVKNLSAQVSLDAEFRPRTEFRNGFRKPLADTLWPAFVTFQRTRLTADYKSKVINTRITLQDSRVWGKSDTKTSDSKIEVYEAWAEYLLTSGISAQFGRQPLKYDDQRLLGAANWSNTGLAHDVLLLKVKPRKSFQVHLGAAYNNSKDTLLEVAYTTKQMYKTMGFMWLSKSFGNGITLTAINILEGLQKTKNYQVVYPRNTSGANVVFQSDSSRFTGTAFLYVQNGRSSSFEKLKAYAFSAKAGYKMNKYLMASAGIDYYSGTSPTVIAGESNTFNKLYGANHSFNVYMEYFQAIPKAGLTGLFCRFYRVY